LILLGSALCFLLVLLDYHLTTVQHTRKEVGEVSCEDCVATSDTPHIFEICYHRACRFLSTDYGIQNSVGCQRVQWVDENRVPRLVADVKDDFSLRFVLSTALFKLQRV
jgi:hypothetical protein